MQKFSKKLSRLQSNPQKTRMLSTMNEKQYTYSMLATVNAMVNFKQLYPYGSNLCGN